MLLLLFLSLFLFMYFSLSSLLSASSSLLLLLLLLLLLQLLLLPPSSSSSSSETRQAGIHSPNPVKLSQAVAYSSSPSPITPHHHPPTIITTSASRRSSNQPGHSGGPTVGGRHACDTSGSRMCSRSGVTTPSCQQDRLTAGLCVLWG